jgi:hypothetical protein
MGARNEEKSFGVVQWCVPPSQYFGSLVLGVPPPAQETTSPTGSTVQPAGMGPSSESWKESGKRAAGGGVEGGGLAAVEFGADGVEIHEPALEQRPRHRLQRRVHQPVQLDLVVQRPKHHRDGFLLGLSGVVVPRIQRIGGGLNQPAALK